MAAVGVAWVARRPGRWRWVGVVPLVVVRLDNANYNAVADSVALSSTWVSTAISWVGSHLAGLVVLAVVVLTVVDRLVLAGARRGRGDVLLKGEPANGLDPRPVLRLAVLAPPWSTSVTWAVVLVRLAALTAAANRAVAPAGGASSPDGASPPAGASSVACGGSAGGASSSGGGGSAGVASPAGGPVALGLVDQVPALVARLERADSAQRWRAGAARVIRGVDLRALLSWRVVVWLVGLLPAVACLVVGGFPATRELQKTMTGTVGAWSIVIGAVAGAVLVALQVPALVRAARARTEPVLHEARLRPAARLATAGSSLLLTGFVLAALAGGHRPTDSIVSNYHALDASSSAEFAIGLALIVLSFAIFPPAGAVLMGSASIAGISGASITVLTGAGAATLLGGAVAATGLSVVTHAMLNQASEADWSSSTGGYETGSGGSDFDYDPYDPFTGKWFNPEGQPPSYPPRVTSYREHALKRLELRGFTRGQVEDLVSSPPKDPIWQPGPGTWRYEGTDGLEVLVNLAGIVVSAF